MLSLLLSTVGAEILPCKVDISEVYDLINSFQTDLEDEPLASDQSHST
jgi:hypothetical protein